MSSGRPRRAIKDIDKHDFKRLSKTSKSPRERLRFLGLLHIQEGKSYTEVADILKVTYSTVMQWVKKFRAKGIEGLREQPGRGRKPNLPQEEEDAFKLAVLELQANREGGRIRGLDIVELLEKEFGVKSSLNSVYDTLRRVGLVWITGRSQHPKADKEAQEAFKKTSKIKS